MMRYAKQFCALTAAGAVGVWLGINYTAKLVNPIALQGEVPAWVPQAEWMAIMSIVALAVASGGWMALDHMEVKKQ